MIEDNFNASRKTLIAHTSAPRLILVKRGTNAITASDRQQEMRSSLS